MPYIGAKQLKASNLKRFSVTGSTSATHVLTWTAPNEQSLIITINGVKQHDGAYTISGSPTTITLSSALVATDEMEVIGINDIGTTITPAQNSVNTDKIVDDAVTSAKLANAISITSGNSLTIDSGATVTNNGTASGFGKVLQVVQAVKTDSFSSSSASYVDVTGLSASITPSSTSNKILSIITLMVSSGSAGQDRKIAYNLSRDSTMIFESIWRIYDYNGANGVTGSLSSPITYLDSPSSTSALTYKVQVKKVTGAGAAEVNIVSPSTSSIILMEIEG